MQKHFLKFLKIESKSTQSYTNIEIISQTKNTQRTKKYKERNRAP